MDHNVFSCINICQCMGSRGSCLDTRPLGRVFKHGPRGLASVNVMKQTCVIVTLAYFTRFRQILYCKRHLNIKLSIFLHWISLNKMASASNFPTSLPPHNLDARNVFVNKNIGTMISQGRNTFPCNVMRTI